jgi:hypothetical protein
VKARVSTRSRVRGGVQRTCSTRTELLTRNCRPPTCSHHLLSQFSPCPSTTSSSVPTATSRRLVWYGHIAMNMHSWPTIVEMSPKTLYFRGAATRAFAGSYHSVKNPHRNFQIPKMQKMRILHCWRKTLTRWSCCFSCTTVLTNTE